MTADKIAEINTERLAGWNKRLQESHATPVVLIGVGHDEKSGDLVLCVVENGPSDRELAGWLRWAANQLDKGTASIGASKERR